MKLKYVIVERQGIESPILFPQWIQHKEVENLGRVVSAGECEVYVSESEQKVYAFGESVSLGVKSRGSTDATVIEYHIENSAR